MDFSFAAIWSNLMIGLLGFSFFLYGKKAARPYPLIAGLAMSIYPFFISSPLWLWTITAAILAALYALREQ